MSFERIIDSAPRRASRRAGLVGRVLGVLVAPFLLDPAPPPVDVLPVPWASYEYIGPGIHDERVHPIETEATDAQWSIDWPENPDSIIAMLTYRAWNAEVPFDLSHASMTIRVRGELEMHGGYLRFWVVAGGNRWHLDEPIPLGETITLSLTSDGPWQRTWDRDPQTIESTLASVESYGLAFVGFTEEVTGILALEQMHFYGSVSLEPLAR